MTNAIEPGNHIPAITVKKLTSDGMTDVRTDDILGKGLVVLFAVPGAYTPTCSAKHLPSFTTHIDEFKQKGVDKIVCLAINDPFVMKFWLEANGATGIVEPLADGNGAFTQALGLTMDGSAYGLGTRSQRFAMIIKNGVVQALAIEKPGEFNVSSGESMLAALDTLVA